MREEQKVTENLPITSTSGRHRRSVVRPSLAECESGELVNFLANPSANESAWNPWQHTAQNGQNDFHDGVMVTVVLRCSLGRQCPLGVETPELDIDRFCIPTIQGQRWQLSVRPR